MSKKFRFEFKYEIDPNTAYLIEKDIVKYGMKPDSNISSLNGEYFVTSLYYDSYDLSDYRDKIDGLIRRKKFRLRVYKPTIGESQTVWLEIKNKHQQENFKTRMLLTNSEFEDFFMRGNVSLLEKKWAEKEIGKKATIIQKPALNEIQKSQMNQTYNTSCSISLEKGIKKLINN